MPIFGARRSVSQRDGAETARTREPEMQVQILRRKALFVSACQTQPLFVSFVLRLEPTTTPIVGMQGCQQTIGRRGRGGPDAPTQAKEHGIREAEDQDMIAPQPVGLLCTQRQLPGGLAIRMRLLDPSDLAIRQFRVGVPLSHRDRQFLGATPVFDLDQHLIVTLQHPVDFSVFPTTTINAHNRAHPLVCGQFQDSFSSRQQFLQAGVQLAFAIVEAINHDFIIPTGQNAPELSPAAVFLMGEIALGDPFTLPTRRQARDIQQLPLGLVIVLVGLRLLPKHNRHGRAQLGHIVDGTRVQSITDRRLVGAGLPAKRLLHRTIRAHAGIDLDQAHPAGQDRDEAVQQFVERRVLQHLLFDRDMLGNHRPQAHLAHPQAQCDQTGPRRKLNLFVHDDGSSRRSVSTLTIQLR
jgi:hypothetical protein